MNATALALVGYIVWMIVLLAVLAILRSALTLTGKRAANAYTPSGADVSPFSERLCRAHANCYESFPILGGLLLLALATQNTSITNPLAFAVLGARLGQSTIHLISTSVPAVLVRFALFLTQVGIALYWAFLFAGRFGV